MTDQNWRFSNYGVSKEHTRLTNLSSYASKRTVINGIRGQLPL
jgi:hypothetical protein